MKKLSRAYNALIFLFLYIPIIMIIVYSFNANKSRGRWTGFTLDWYVSLFNNENIKKALGTTLQVAIVSTLLATVIGTLAAVGIYAMGVKLRRVMMTVNNIPMVNPEIVTGISMMLLISFFIRLIPGFQAGKATLIMAHTTFCIPYVVLQVLPKLRQMNKHMYEAALDLGCRPVPAFFRVILPEILPGVITGALMALTISLDDFVVSYFTSGNTQTLSVAIYAMLKRQVKPDMNALAALMFGAVLLLLLLVNAFQLHDQKKKQRVF